MSNTPARYRRLPARRTFLKTMHVLMPFLFFWFLVIQPLGIVPFGEASFHIHSRLALLFVTLSLLWFADYLRRGLAGRPGPKLGPRARKLHRFLHLSLMWGILMVAVSGFLLGLTSDKLLKAGNFLPIAPPLDLPRLNELVGLFHTYEFYALGVIAVVHAGFHVWRHVSLKDNALRIMAPKALHRFL